MKSLLSIFVSFLASTTASSATQDAAAEIVRRLHEQNYAQITRESILAEHRDEVLAILRGQAERGDYEAEMILLYIGDTQTIAKYVDIFVDTNGVNWTSRRILEGTPSAAVIEALAPLMFRDEEYTYHNSPHAEFPGAWGASYESAAIVRNQLAGNPEIPAETASWANTLPREPSPELRDTMRQWWQQNRQHFESGSLDNLQPLQESEIGETSSSVSVAVETDQPTESTTAIVEESASLDSHSSATPLHDDNDRRLWPYGLAAALAVLGIGVIAYRLRAS